MTIPRVCSALCVSVRFSGLLGVLKEPWAPGDSRVASTSIVAQVAEVPPFIYSMYDCNPAYRHLYLYVFFLTPIIVMLLLLKFLAVAALSSESCIQGSECVARASQVVPRTLEVEQFCPPPQSMPTAKRSRTEDECREVGEE